METGQDNKNIYLDNFTSSMCIQPHTCIYDGPILNMLMRMSLSIADTSIFVETDEDVTFVETFDNHNKTMLLIGTQGFHTTPLILPRKRRRAGMNGYLKKIRKMEL